ncbi:hypothetical protein HYW82_00880 [Candidatus Peregrinibacteria bacterium]|nr:hypothetical protein [Candidatus Peregrinibacteria bacterium]
MDIFKKIVIIGLLVLVFLFGTLTILSAWGVVSDDLGEKSGATLAIILLLALTTGICVRVIVNKDYKSQR